MADKLSSGKKLDHQPGESREISTSGEETARTGAPSLLKAGIPALNVRPAAAPTPPPSPAGPRTPRNAGVGITYPGGSSASSTTTTANSPVASSTSHPPVDYKIRRDAAIDQFKSRYPADFVRENFAIAFAILLRQWKRDNRDADIAVVPEAMKRLYRKVNKDIGDGGTMERDGPPVQSPVRKPQAGNYRASGSAATASSTPRGSTSTPPLSLAKVTLNDERLDLLGRFTRKATRRPSFERYPTLLDRLYGEAHAWARKDTGGSFGLALKTIFEDALLECFHGTCLLMGDAPPPDMNDMQAKIKQWKTENKGEDLTLEALWRILPRLMRSLMVDTVEPTAATRNAEAITEAFMQRTGVLRELLENRLLKKRFLHDIRAWIALGQFSQYPEITVQQIYHEALTLQYQESLAAMGVDAAQIGKVRLAAMHWWEDHDGDVLTTEVLAALFASVSRKDKG